MNKTKNMRRMAGAMAVVVAAGAAGTCGYQRSAITAKAAEVDTEKLEEVAENALSTKSDDTEETGTTKEESVYVKADPSGKVKKTTVTEWLKNTGKGELSDTSDLSDIKNIKGDEEYKESGDELSWEAVGDDIYYQGTIDKELPVDVKVSYKLDGKSISPKDLKGKSGKVEIQFSYDNKSKQTVNVNGEDVEMYTPFTMVSAMMLSSDEYSNVSVENGKLISDGDKNIVVGVAFPGLANDLNLKDLDMDIDIPETVTITADVKDATVGTSITMASAELMNEFGLDDIDSFDDLQDSIDDLEDATNQLVDGSKEAADGSKELADGAGTLNDGAGTLASGAGTLADGVNTLNEKSGTLVSGVNTLASGVQAYTGGVEEIYAGSNDLAVGAESAATGAAGVATGAAGINQAINGEGGVSDSVNTLAGYATSVNNGLGGISAAVNGGVSALQSITQDSIKASVTSTGATAKITITKDEIAAKIKDTDSTLSANQINALANAVRCCIPPDK